LQTSRGKRSKPYESLSCMRGGNLRVLYTYLFGMFTVYSSPFYISDDTENEKSYFHKCRMLCAQYFIFFIQHLRISNKYGIDFNIYYLFVDRSWGIKRLMIIMTYIPLTLYLQKGSKDISDIRQRHPYFTKMT
jgi:hypothetical protein